MAAGLLVSLCVNFEVLGWTLPDSPQRVWLRRENRPDTITIIYGQGLEAKARELSQKLAAAGKMEAPAQLPAEKIMIPAWQIAPEWRGKNLLLLGNIYNNKAILALATKRLAACNRVYPGQDGYELRALFSPLQRQADMIVIGGMSNAGLDAGIARLLQLLKSTTEGLGLPPVQERGTARGPAVPPKWRGVQGEQMFADAVSEFYWHGQREGLTEAAKLLQTELDKHLQTDRSLWNFDRDGHYRWETAIGSYWLLSVSGGLPEKMLEQCNVLWARMLLNNRDYYGAKVLRPGNINEECFARHEISGLASLYMLAGYLVHAADQTALTPAQTQRIAAHFETLSDRVKALLAEGRTRGRAYAGASDLEMMCNLANLYCFTGYPGVLDNNIFLNMTKFYYIYKDNLGFASGVDSYLDSGLGTQFFVTTGGAGALAYAFFFNDGQVRWLRDNTHFSNYCLAVRYPPGMLECNIAAEYPGKYDGLCVLKTERYLYRNVITKQRKTNLFTPYDGTYEQAFSMAAFRDGFKPQDPYLLLLGQDSGHMIGTDRNYQVNAIARYTDLDSLLLYQNTWHNHSWGKSVVSVSCGKDLPQSLGACIDGKIKAPEATALSSRMEDYGGTRWTRNIIHRRKAYFAVLDEFVAKESAEYSFTCRWRSYHDGEQVSASRFAAMDPANGVKLNIVQSAPVPTRVEALERDGSSTPTVVEQCQSLPMRPGQKLLIGNVLYADGEARPGFFDTKKVTDNMILVKGRLQGREILDCVGTGAFKFANIEGEAGIWLIAGDMAVLGNCRKLVIDNRPIDIKPGQNYEFSKGGKHDGTLSAIATELAAKWTSIEPAAAVATTLKPQSADKVRLTAQKVLGELPPPRKIAKSVRVKIDSAQGFLEKPENWFDRRLPSNSYGTSGWNSGKGEITLDLGKTTNIHGLRLIWPCTPALSILSRRIGGAKILTPAEVEVTLAVSTDNKHYTPVAAKPETENYYLERIAYLATRRHLAAMLKIDADARYIKIAVKPGPGAQGGFYVDEMEVVLNQRCDRAYVNLRSSSKAAPDDIGLAAWNPDLLLLFSRAKGLVKKIPLESPIVDLHLDDLDSNGKQEIVYLPLSEVFTAYNHDGSLRFAKDLFAMLNGDKQGMTGLRPGGFLAWRPDAKGKLEYAFLSHYRLRTFTPEPDFKHTEYQISQTGPMGGKTAIRIPDSDGDGKEDMAIIYGYVRDLLIVPSSTKSYKPEYRKELTGHSSGNRQGSGFYAGAVVWSADPKPQYLGLMAVNPGGVSFFSRKPEFHLQWEHFSFVPNMSMALWNSRKSGAPNVYIGRKDGYITGYEALTGRQVASGFIGHEARALAAFGDYLAAGSSAGLFILDAKLEIVASVSEPVDALTATGDILNVGFSSGKIQTFKLP